MRKLKLLLVSFLCCYFLAGLLAGFTERGEMFPLFSGHWFYKTPTEFNDYGLLITSLDGEELKTPTFLDKIYSRFAVWPFAAYGAIQRWGHSVSENQKDQDAQKAAVESLILGSRKYKLQLVKRQFNSLEYLKSGDVKSMQVLLDVEK